MTTNSTPALGTIVVRLLCASLMAACGSAPSAAGEPTEVELAAPVESGGTRARPLVVAASPDETSEPRHTRGRAVSEHPCSAAGWLRSIESATSLHVDFLNETAGTVSLHWIDFGGKLVHYADIASGETHPQQTYVTHPWIALDRDEQCRGVFVPNGPGTHTVVIGAR